MKLNKTVIIGGGISGLACARTLSENGEDFIIISENIGGRILTSQDCKVNYGAFFVCSDYDNVLKFAKLKSQIRFRDFCFHEGNKTFVLFDPKILKHLFQFYKVSKLLYKFRKAFCKLRKTSETISQKKAIENDRYLHNLYLQNAADFVKKKNIERGTKTYLAKGLYSTTFSTVSEMNAFSFLQFTLPLITPIYRFSFEKEKMIQPFQDNIITGHVEDITYKNGQYKVKTKKNIFESKNIVLATQIDWSKRYAKVNITNLPVSTNMLHIKGNLKKIFLRNNYQLFNPPDNVQAIANLNDGTYLFYYKDKP